MALVSVQQVTRQFGPRVVLDGLSVDFSPGEIVGLIGANGAGKTTLFRLIAGEIEPDLGTISRAASFDVGYLRQEPEITLDRTLHDEVARAFDDILAIEHRLHDVSERMAVCTDQQRLSELMKEYDRLNERFIVAGGHQLETRLGEILSGLGFAAADHAKPMRLLSGGQKCRAALARLLLTDSTFLLLDEPTNHLDIDAVRWLEEFLRRHGGGAVIISHDRYLLDRVCTRIVEIEGGRAINYPGNYSNYVQTKARRELTQQRQFEKDADFIRKERAFIAKHLAGQRTKEAQGRRTRLERRLNEGEFTTENVRQRKSARISFQQADAGTGTVLRCDELSMSFGAHVLFDNLRLQVDAGQRFGITGPNGTGKTTLLRLILGQIEPSAGTITRDGSLQLGYYSQEHLNLDLSRTILEEVRAARPEMSEQQLRSYLGQFLFSGDDVFKPLSKLSGGEQSRVRLASLILQSPDLLILDEPTNHLDIPSRERLEEALTDFAGTLLVVSHDRYFLDRVVDRLLILRPESWRVYNGNYSFYLEHIERERAAAAADAESAPSKTRTEKRKQRRPGRDEQPRKETSPTAQFNHLTVEQLEEMVVERETRLARLHEKFADPQVMRDPDALAELQEEMESVQGELEVLDMAWNERAEGMA